MKYRKESFNKNDINSNDQTATFCQTYADENEERTYDCIDSTLQINNPSKSFTS